MSPDSNAAVRLDKWLWAARFFKTRSLAAAAIDGGKVHLNGTRVKRGRLLQVGDEVSIRKGPYEYRIRVQVLSEQRRSGTEAAALYEEFPDSRRRRETLAEQFRIQAVTGVGETQGRPSKRDRRKIRRFKGRD
jgi:ribosome-associated heat shock protein Hsp15